MRTTNSKKAAIIGSAVAAVLAALVGCTQQPPETEVADHAEEVLPGQYVDVEGLDTDGYWMPRFVAHHEITGTAFVRLDVETDALFGYDLEADGGHLCAYPTMGLESAQALPADTEVVSYEVHDDEGWVKRFSPDQALACVDDPDDVAGLNRVLIGDADELFARGAVVASVEIETPPERVSHYDWEG